MRLPLALALALALVLVAPTASVRAQNAAGGHEVVVAVLDTGARATHDEFAAGQIVAWWDFTNERGSLAFPAPGMTWDARSAPYDANGHGTATAARVGGKTTSLAPGTKLAIGKVGTGAANGGIQNLGRAYDWAVNTVHADIISISIGGIAPTPGQLDGLDDEMKAAAAQGVLTVVAAGNGAGDACGPEVSWTTSYGYSRDALSVGSLFADGGANTLVTCSAFDPDVSAEGYDARVACPASDSCFTSESGTSFAAPHVAGAAARALQAALDAGQDPSPARLKELMRGCSTDEGWPYAIQGAGMIEAAATQRAVDHARAGALCADNGAATTSVGTTESYEGRYLFSEFPA